MIKKTVNHNHLGKIMELYLESELEKQSREVFFNMLKRIGAFLDGPDKFIKEFQIAESPIVSVIVPVFNRSSFIGRSIESVLKGYYSDFEIIVVDNGSVDGTKELVKAYVQRDPRVRLIENWKNVIALSRNIGIKAARGKYIAQLDSDDEYTENTLGDMVDFLENNPHCALAISYYEFIDENGQTLHQKGIIKHLEYNRNNILRTDGAGAVRVWRRSVLLELGGFDENEFGNYGEDYDMVLKVSENYQVGRVHRVLYKYRQHQGNTNHRVPAYHRYRSKMLARLRAIERRIIQNKKRTI
jgi:glycosyltransferase involved in cell wall biosynthesis